MLFRIKMAIKCIVDRPVNGFMATLEAPCFPGLVVENTKEVSQDFRTLLKTPTGLEIRHEGGLYKLLCLKLRKTQTECPTHEIIRVAINQRTHLVAGNPRHGVRNISHNHLDPFITFFFSLDLISAIRTAARFDRSL